MSDKPKTSGIRVFYTLVITQVLSLIGSQMSSLAIGIWVYIETGNATPLGLVAFFLYLPKILASSISGVLADRLDRRYLIAFADAGQAIGTVFLLITFASGSFELWHLYLVALIQGIFSVFQAPAFMASVTMLIPDDQRDRANTILQLIRPSAGIIAPAIVGFVFALVGVVGTLLIDLATFLIAVTVVLNVHIPRPEQTAVGKASQSSLRREVLAGIRYLLDRRPLLYILLYMMMLNFFFAGLGVLFTPYILARTGSETILGVLLSLLNIGAILGGTVWSYISGRRRFPRAKVMIIGIAIIGLLMASMGIAHTPFGLAIVMFFLLIPMPAVNSSIISLLQIKVAPDVQGRVFAVADQMASFFMPLSYFIVGPLVDTLFEPAVNQPGWDTFAPIWGSEVGSGMGMVFSLAGLIGVFVSIVALLTPSIRDLDHKLPDYVATPQAEEHNTEAVESESLETVHA